LPFFSISYMSLRRSDDLCPLFPFRFLVVVGSRTRGHFFFPHVALTSPFLKSHPFLLPVFHQTGVPPLAYSLFARSFFLTFTHVSFVVFFFRGKLISFPFSLLHDTFYLRPLAPYLNSDLFFPPRNSLPPLRRARTVSGELMLKHNLSPIRVPSNPEYGSPLIVT